MLDATLNAKEFRNSNGITFRIMERSKTGKHALLINDTKDAVTPYIIAWNCPEETGSWGQGHYYCTLEVALEEWNKEYKNS